MIPDPVMLGSGAQTVERAIDLLRRLAQCDPKRGASLAQLAADMRIKPSAARRLLQSLLRRGLIFQTTDKHYKLALGLVRLGRAAEKQVGLMRLCEDSVDRLAREIGDAIMLTARMGDEAVCLALRKGAYPVQVAAQTVGDRRPLGMGSGSIAILAAMERYERERLIAGLKEPLSPFAPGFTKASLTEIVDAAAERGLQYHDGRFLPGVRELALAVRDARGRPQVALSVVAIESRLPDERLAEVIALLQREKRVIEQRLRTADTPAQV